MPKVAEDAVLLINANEILAKDGIHGKIAQVGIGFGTGRHTEGRRQGGDGSKNFNSITQKNQRANSAHNRKLFVNKWKAYEKPKPAKCPHHGSNSPHRHPPVPRAKELARSGSRSPKRSENKTRSTKKKNTIEVQTDPYEVVYNTYEPEVSEYPHADDVYETTMPPQATNEVPPVPKYRVFNNVDWATSELYLAMVAQHPNIEHSFK